VTQPKVKGILYVTAKKFPKGFYLLIRVNVGCDAAQKNAG
jgi:hypothetical protein